MYERITLDNLTRYDSKLKGWLGGRLAPAGSTAPMALTEKAGAVSCWPVGGTPLLPAVDFLFTETGPASGDKGPENPSTITGVSSMTVTRCGKNLLKHRDNISSTIISGVTFTVNEDGTYTVDGTASDTAHFYIVLIANGIVLKNGLTYTLSGCPTGGSSSTYRLAVGNNYIDNGDGRTFTVSENITVNCQIIVYSGTTVSNLVFRPQLELGSTATSFEPYEGNDYTIQLGNTYYGGIVDLATGLMTVTWVGVAYDGTETIIKQGDLGDGTPQYSLPVPSYCVTGTELKVVSTHFPFGYTAGCAYVRTTGGTGYRVYPVGYDTLESFTAWVASQYAAGTPLTVAYKTASPITVQLTPTQILSLAQTDKYTPRINTIYTDASAVQVGYVKSPIREEQELTQAIVVQGGGV